MAESGNETIYDKDLKNFQIRRTWEKRFFLYMSNDIHVMALRYCFFKKKEKKKIVLLVTCINSSA